MLMSLRGVKRERKPPRRGRSNLRDCFAMPAMTWLNAVILVFFLLFNQGLVFSQEKVDEEIGQTIIDILKDVLPPNPDRIVQFEGNTGKLIIQDTPSNHKLIDEIIKAIDKEPSQIDIETRFVEFKVTDTDEFGLNWGSTFVLYDFGRTSVVEAGHKSTRWRVRGYDATSKTLGDLITFSTSTTAGLDLSIARLNTAELDFFIHALERSNKANLLSSPKVTTISGQEANIQLTNTVPYIETAEKTIEGGVNTWVPTMNEVSRGIKLIVEPTVGKAGIINLRLLPTVEVVTDRLTVFNITGIDDLGWPVVGKRSCETRVQVKSGATVILGGLIRDAHTVYDKKVPLLGDLPLLGNLFRHKYVNREKKNLLIFVTATLVSSSGEMITK